MMAGTFFASIDEAIARYPDEARKIDAVFNFNVDGRHWTIDCTTEPPSVMKGPALREHLGSGRPPKCVDFRCTGDDFEAMTEDSDVGMRLYFAGRLRVTGAARLASRLGMVLELVRMMNNERKGKDPHDGIAG